MPRAQLEYQPVVILSRIMAMRMMKGQACFVTNDEV